MEINSLYQSNNILKPGQKKGSAFSGENLKEQIKEKAAPKSINYRANYFPYSFKGNAPEIKNAYFITKTGENIPVEKSENEGEYLINKESSTGIIYGKEAIKYLSAANKFEYDTQIIFPKKSKGSITTDKKRIDLEENSGILISKGTEAKVSVEKGYPLIVVTKSEPKWYDKFENGSEKNTIRDKFFEIMMNNAHSYNGEFKTDLLITDELKDDEFLRSIGINKYECENLLSELTEKKDKLNNESRDKISFLNNLFDKLKQNSIITEEKGYYHFTKGYNPQFTVKFLEEKGLSEKEINTIMPALELSRNLHMQTTISRQNNAQSLSVETIKKMKDEGILFNNKKNTDTIYWKKEYVSEEALREDLQKGNFTPEEIENIVNNKKQNWKTGFDISGLKFINDNIAVYNLKDKVNNWTLEETNWITNSTALANKKGETPSTGISMVQANENRIYDIDELRKGEELHTHPDLPDKHQTELYLITSGTAIMNIVKDGKTELLKLKEGDLAVIQPGVEHCINSVKGEYEQIVVQIPSAFQYGFGFKQKITPPEDYDKEELKNRAKKELEKE